MGVTKGVLPDEDIQSKASLAEALIIRSVPSYAELVGDELTFLESACIAQVCALLCPGMAQRVKVMQQDETLYAFKIQAINWDNKKREFEGLIGEYIGLAAGYGGVALSLVGVVYNDRPKI